MRSAPCQYDIIFEPLLTAYLNRVLSGLFYDDKYLVHETQSFQEIFTSTKNYPGSVPSFVLFQPALKDEANNSKIG